MPRPHLIRTDEFPYHVTARTNNKEWFYVTIRECWDIFSEHLKKISSKYEAKIISFVLMSNHFHMLLRTPNLNLDDIMRDLLRDVSKEVGLRSNRINHLFGGKYHRCLINSDIYFAHAYKYLLRNPVEAKIVQKVEDYEFSTLRKFVKNGSLSFTCVDLEEFPNEYIPVETCERIDWLNEPYLKGHKNLVRNALRKNTFQFSKGNDHKKEVDSLLNPKRYAVPFRISSIF